MSFGLAARIVPPETAALLMERGALCTLSLHQEDDADADTRRAIKEILALLPDDVTQDLNRGKIDVNDPAFLDGLADHVARLSLADPRTGQRVLGKIIKLKKSIRRGLRQSDPDAVTSSTVTRQGQLVGRNAPCPCGSGRKFKQCCLRKQ